MARRNRDDFTDAVKAELAKQVGSLCSNPDCRKITTGPHENPEKSVSIGVAAHICAASPGPNAKRYDSNQTPMQRKCIENGIWLCQDHAKLIDSDEIRYTRELLHDWKRQAREHARDSIERPNKRSVRPSYKRWILVSIPPVIVCSVLAAMILPNVSFGPSPSEKRTELLANHLTKYKSFMSSNRAIIMAQLVLLDKITDLNSWEHARSNGSLKAMAILIQKQTSALTTKEALDLFSEIELVAPCLKSQGRLPEDDKQDEAWKSWNETFQSMPMKGPKDDAQVKEWVERVRALLIASLNANRAREKSVGDAIKKCIAEETPR